MIGLPVANDGGVQRSVRYSGFARICVFDFVHFLCEFLI